MKKINPLFKMFGGKFYLTQFITSNFPNNYQDLHFVEGCCGASSITLNKLPSKTETINDADEKIINIYNHLQHPEFIKTIQNTEYNQETFLKAKETLKNFKPDLNHAIAELIVRRMSRTGMKKHFSWSERLRGGLPGDLNAWNNFKLHQLPLIQNRLKNVTKTSLDIKELILKHNTEDCFYYLDPPYLPETRTAKNVYDLEMTEKDHIELADLLKKTKSKVLLSGYYSALYVKMYKGWNMTTKVMPNHASQSKIKQSRIECLWSNY